MFTPPRARNPCRLNDKPWAYPPLPPNHTVCIKKVSYSNSVFNFATGDDVSSQAASYGFQNVDCDRVKKIINKFDSYEYDHEDSDCESMCIHGTESESKIDRNNRRIEEIEKHTNKINENRMRGGCGSSCSYTNEVLGCQKKFTDVKNCGTSPPKYNNHCINMEQQTSPCENPAVTVCSHYCPQPRIPPIHAKTSRCNSPCKSNGPGCGSGGCCGSSGCQGGCGKAGQLCLPLRTCSGSTFRNQSFVSRLHWSLSKSGTPRPVVCHSRTQTTYGQTNIHDNQQVNDMKNDNYDNCEQLSRSKSGCECLGGGLDCQRCGRKVYQAEMMVLIAAGSPYHAICFSCYCCRKPLEPLTYQENCGEIYCKQCLIRNFGPQGYGYGIGAGVLQTPI